MGGNARVAGSYPDFSVSSCIWVAVMFCLFVFRQEQKRNARKKKSKKGDENNDI